MKMILLPKEIDLHKNMDDLNGNVGRRRYVIGSYHPLAKKTTSGRSSPVNPMPITLVLLRGEDV